MIKVLVVDDSRATCRILRRILEQDPTIRVVGTAPDPVVASELLAEHLPDVMTLDLQMPHMDGLTFLRRLPALSAARVVVVSSSTPAGGVRAVQALDAGACEVVCKPAPGDDFVELAEELRSKVRIAARSRLRRSVALQPAALSAGVPLVRARTASRVIAIGASTGGTVAIEAILRALPPDVPPVVVVQHMPAAFTPSFAARLNEVVPMKVREARHGEPLEPGVALIAPGSHHLLLRGDGARLAVALSEGAPVNRHRPSVDVLFETVAETLRADAVGCILTGMGRDGAAGLLRMRAAGAHTIAQDEATSVVYGMPKSAVEAGAVLEVLPLNLIPARLLRRATER